MTADPALGRHTLVGTRLATMMFLEFFIWGAWYVTLGPYMAAMLMSSKGIGDAYSVGPLAAIISPFFLGIVADRFFATQRVLGVLHIVGGLALIAAPLVAEALPVREVVEEGRMIRVRDHLPFVALLLGHMLCYMPTLGLTNALAFHHLTDQEKQFPLIRVLGTIGWIVAGWVVGLAIAAAVPAVAPADGSDQAASAARAATDAARAASPVFFTIAGGAGVLMGVYSFFLPHTPPPGAGQRVSVRSILGLDALSMMKDRSFAVFMIGSLLICIPLAAYYSFAGVYVGATGTPAAEVPRVMTYGQMSEIFFMLVMPLCFARLGVKWMLAIGMLAWVVRYGLFAGAWGSTDAEQVKWLVLGGILLHGICYDFFFVTGFIYVDKRVGREIRGQAQGLLVLVTQGLGLGLGAQAIGALVTANTTDGAIAWRTVWMWPSLFALAVLLVFVALFRDGGRRAPAPSP